MFFIVVDRCDPVPSVVNAMPVSRSALKGQRVDFVCDAGFQNPTEGAIYSTCDGTRWSSVAATGCGREYIATNFIYYG